MKITTYTQITSITGTAPWQSSSTAPHRLVPQQVIIQVSILFWYTGNRIKLQRKIWDSKHNKKVEYKMQDYNLLC